MNAPLCNLSTASKVQNVLENFTKFSNRFRFDVNVREREQRNVCTITRSENYVPRMQFILISHLPHKLRASKGSGMEVRRRDILLVRNRTTAPVCFHIPLTTRVIRVRAINRRDCMLGTKMTLMMEMDHQWKPTFVTNNPFVSISSLESGLTAPNKHPK